MRGSLESVGKFRRRSSWLAMDKDISAATPITTATIYGETRSIAVARSIPPSTRITRASTHTTTTRSPLDSMRSRTASVGTREQRPTIHGTLRTDTGWSTTGSTTAPRRVGHKKACSRLHRLARLTFRYKLGSTSRDRSTLRRMLTVRGSEYSSTLQAAEQTNGL